MRSTGRGGKEVPLQRQKWQTQEEFCFFSGMLGRIRERLISKSNNAAMAFVSNSTGMSVWFEQFFRGSWHGEYNSSQLAVLGDQMTQRFSLKA